MKKITYLIVLLLSSSLAFSQVRTGSTKETVILASNKGNSRITGSIIDATNNETVPFATVALIDLSTGKPIDGSICDEFGKFTITKVEEGNYQIVVSFIGYKNTTLDNIKVSGKNEELNLGMVKISPDIKQLDEVIVEGQKALIEEKVDRTVYNAENDATNKGGDATDVLRKVPMLSLDLDGNVSLRGSQNIKVLINNRPSTITAGSVADALKQIPSDQIKSVEVITSPSARYDAEGSAGIINIITKKNSLEGMSLNVDASAGLRGSNLGLNGNYRKGKLGLSIGGWGRKGYNINGSFDNVQETGTSGNSILNNQSADTRERYGFGRYTLGLDYDFNKNNFITGSFTYGFRDRNNFQDELLTQTYVNGTLSGSSLRDVNIQDMSHTMDVSLNYTHLFKKPQREFSLLTLYSRNNRTNDFLNDSLNSDFSTSNSLRNLNNSYNQEITVQADFLTPVGKTQILEFGGKNILRDVTSEFRSETSIGDNGPWIPMGASSGRNFEYNQNVTAAYIAYTLNFWKNYSLKLGSRYEYTMIDASFASQGDISIPSYGSLVPSVNVSRKFKNGSMVKAAYNRRIQRPGLQFLNPNRINTNPLSVNEGNPNLDPEFTDNYELGYTAYINKTSLNFAAFMRNSHNAIEALRDTTSGDLIRTSYANIGTQDAYGMNISVNINISDKLSLNGGSDIFYSILKNNVPNELYSASNEGWVANFRVFGSYKLPKGWALQAFSFYRGRQVQLQGVLGGFRMYSLNIRKEFNEKRGSIGFGADNFITPSITIKNELISPVIRQSSTTVLNNLSFKVNFSYRFGKMSMEEPRKRKRSINNDDMKSEGDGGGAQEGGAPAGGGGGQQRGRGR